ncbi:MAG: DNA-directed RNA polymerase subunit beta', partial [Oscillospiraceae bacterium]|nr:DNA-directed RNA polymerase subunit beta' [Oscillospiraceae bacterium]
KRMVERLRPEIWDVLEEVIKEHPVFLNRAPTLHRLGIQAFEPVLVEGRALKLHPLVCTAFNADFDGDQMAVHVPLSVEAQAEARFLMLSANNLLKPQDGRPVTVPTQDMVLGSYYLNLYKHGEPGEGKVFASEEEVLLAYNAKAISLHSIIKVRKTAEFEGRKVTGIIQTTCGRIIFNEVVPQNLGFVDRSKIENVLDYEVDVKTRPATEEEAKKLAEYELAVAEGKNPEVYMNAEQYLKKVIVDEAGNRIENYYIITDRNLVGKKMLGKIIDKCIAVFDMTKTAEVLDALNALGFKYSTKGAITISVSDIEIPEEKAQYLAEAEEKIEKITKQYRRGLMTDDERYVQVINTWNETSTKVTNALMSKLDQYNPIFMMADSGARGSVNQIRQLAAMRGLMANTSGRAVEIPIRANFREGLNVLEYFISTHGARKGLADTALRTADSGYMTRRLVDVAQDLIIRAEDCGTEEYITVTAIKDGNEMIEKLEDRLEGRYTAEDVVNPSTGEIIVNKGHLMTLAEAGKIVAAGVESVKIRSVLKCELPVGVCAKCYGSNLAVSGKINIGESVGIIAAQSIGEPGTQLTMRTFHTGGVAQAEDITQGLPRVEELFEARKPKGLAVIAEIGGRVAIEEIKNKRKEIKIFNDETGESVSYPISYGSRIKVEEGQIIEPGDELTEGSVNPHDILKIKGVTAVQNYLIQEVQRVYRLQGVDINDRHVEVIVRQMMRKVRVEDPGDTLLLAGSMVDISAIKEANNALEEGQTPATYTDILLGITKASLATDSFLSAASFQETTRVLTDAAIKGKIDPLLGLKENVIIGKLIPAGTGMAKYRNVNIEKSVTETEIAE